MPTAVDPAAVTRRTAFASLPWLCGAPAALASTGAATGARTDAGSANPARTTGSTAAWALEVRQHETRFARSMAERDLAAFTELIAADANFINGGQALRGRAAIVEHWKRHFVAATAPFSWAPESVEVLDTGLLAMTLGPVLSPERKLIANFYSVWRLEHAGVWRVVFDNGYSVPACPAPS